MNSAIGKKILDAKRARTPFRRNIAEFWVVTKIINQLANIAAKNW